MLRRAARSSRCSGVPGGPRATNTNVVLACLTHHKRSRLRGAEARSTAAVAPTPSRLQAPTPYRPPPQQYKAAPRLYSTGASTRGNQNPPADGGWWKWKCDPVLGVKITAPTRRPAAAAARTRSTPRTVDGRNSGKFTRKFQYVAQPGECLLNAPFGFCVPRGDGGANPKHARKAEPKRCQREDEGQRVRAGKSEWSSTFKIADPQLAAYKLNRVDAQLSSYVEDAVRSRPSRCVSWMTSRPSARRRRDAADSGRKRGCSSTVMLSSTLWFWGSGIRNRA